MHSSVRVDPFHRHHQHVIHTEHCVGSYRWVVSGEVDVDCWLTRPRAQIWRQ